MSILIYRDAKTVGVCAATMIAAQILSEPNCVIGVDYHETLLPAFDSLSAMTENGLLAWYGAIDPELLGERYRVYLVVEGEDGKTFYEAFPIFEKELLDGTETGDNGFSAYLPAELNGSSIGVLVLTDGRYYYQQFR